MQKSSESSPFPGLQESGRWTGRSGDLHGMGEARAVEIVLPGKEHLGLGLELAERMGVDDPVPVDLEGVAVVRLPPPPRFRSQSRCRKCSVCMSAPRGANDEIDGVAVVNPTLWVRMSTSPCARSQS